MDPAIASLFAEAVALHRAGDARRAESLYRRVLAADPRHDGAAGLLGPVLADLGRRAEAVGLLRRAVALAPAAAGHATNLAGVLYRFGDLEAAAALAVRAVRLDPVAAVARRLAVQALSDLGRAAAGDHARGLIAHDPGAADGWAALARAEAAQGRFAAQIAAAGRAALVEPQHPERQTDLALALSRDGCLRAGLAAARRAVALAPGGDFGHFQMARIALELSLPALARRHAVRAAMIETTSHVPIGLVIVNELYDPAPNQALLGWALGEVRRRLGRPARLAAARGGGQGPLRVAIVSGALGPSPVTYLIGGFLLHHDPAAIALHLYADVRVEETPIAAALRDRAAVFRFVGGLSDAAVADLLRQDGVELLVDVSGLRAGGRPGLFAAKPCPRALSWPIDLPLGLGIAAAEAAIVDAAHVPPELEKLFPEPILRPARPYIGFWPPADAGAVADPPCDARGAITFGSFSNPAKIGGACLALWAGALKAVPESRLILRYRWMDRPDIADRIRAGLAAAGVDPDRVDLRGGGPRAAMLAAYAEIDIALDTYPYSGGITTLEALWMGVPVITRPGPLPTGRTSLAHLTALGRADWIATDAAGFAALAARLAGDRDGLRDWRGAARAAMAQSPLLDHAGLAAAITGLLRRHCGRPD